MAQRGRKAKKRIASTEVGAFSEGYMTAVMALGREDLAVLYLMRHLINLYSAFIALSDNVRIDEHYIDNDNDAILTFVMTEPLEWDTSSYKNLLFSLTGDFLDKVNIGHKRMAYRYKQSEYYQQILFSVCVVNNTDNIIVTKGIQREL